MAGTDPGVKVRFKPKPSGQWSKVVRDDEGVTAKAMALAKKVAKATTPPASIVQNPADSGRAKPAPKPSQWAVVWARRMEALNTHARVAVPLPKKKVETPRIAPEAELTASDRRVYQVALELSACVFTVLELAEQERYAVRNKLDTLSLSLPIEILRAQSLLMQKDRVPAYIRVQASVRTCLAILDILGARGTIEPEVIAEARTSAAELIEALNDLVRYR